MCGNTRFTVVMTAGLLLAGLSIEVSAADALTMRQIGPAERLESGRTSASNAVTDSLTPIGIAADETFVEAADINRVADFNHVWIGHFGDYRHGTHVNGYSCGHQDNGGKPFFTFQNYNYESNSFYLHSGACADTITEFVAINGSSASVKVRFQGLDSNGGIVLERDTAIPPSATRLLLPSKALQHGVDLGETFIISSNKEVALFGTTFYAVADGQVSDLRYLDSAYSRKATTSAKRQIDLMPIDCRNDDFSYFCDTPTRLSNWMEWVNWARN